MKKYKGKANKRIAAPLGKKDIQYSTNLILNKNYRRVNVIITQRKKTEIIKYKQNELLMEFQCEV